jgi:hypothetical protein
VAASNPTVLRLLTGSAWINGLVAETLTDLGWNDEALASFERATPARETLIKANPTLVRYHEQCLRIYRRKAEIHRRAHRMPQVLMALARASGEDERDDRPTSAEESRLRQRALLELDRARGRP